MSLDKIAVFLDRDGVIIEELHSRGDYVLRPDQVRLMPGSAAAIKRLNKAGLIAIVVTNQAAIARGLITEQGLRLVHARMSELLQVESGARLEKIYYCPYHPEGVIPRFTRTSDSRKPGPGMLVEAARDLKLDLTRCYLVGDQETDIIAAKKVNCKAIAVQTQPFGVNCTGWLDGKPDFVATDLSGAVDWITCGSGKHNQDIN
jgi:D-glycero-D-manno-heptose 1,7-bisphosphate phosphatase